MTKITREELRDDYEHKVFDEGFVGYGPGSDAVLAYRGLSVGSTSEERLVYTIGLLRQSKEPDPLLRRTFRIARDIALKEATKIQERAVRTGITSRLMLSRLNEADSLKFTRETFQLVLEEIRRREVS